MIELNQKKGEHKRLSLTFLNEQSYTIAYKGMRHFFK